MEYKGKLYGKMGHKYFDTGHTTDDYDSLIARIKELEKSKHQKEPEDLSLDIDGRFIKADEFERIWVNEHVNHRYGSSDFLSDSDYIDYHIWEDQNSSEMYKKHLPNAIVIRGTNSSIIFHGGCLRCVSQEKHGIDRCVGCQYFKADWSKPNLCISNSKT